MFTARFYWCKHMNRHTPTQAKIERNCWVCKQKHSTVNGISPPSSLNRRKQFANVSITWNNRDVFQSISLENNQFYPMKKSSKFHCVEYMLARTCETEGFMLHNLHLNQFDSIKNSMRIALLRFHGNGLKLKPWWRVQKKDEKRDTIEWWRIGAKGAYKKRWHTTNAIA